MDIGPILRSARERQKLSQRDVAKQMRVSASAVAQWEMGNTMPTILNRVDLARYLNIPFEDLVPERKASGASTEIDPRILQLAERLLELDATVREVVLMLAETVPELVRNNPELLKALAKADKPA